MPSESERSLLASTCMLGLIGHYMKREPLVYMACSLTSVSASVLPFAWLSMKFLHSLLPSAVSTEVCRLLSGHIRISNDRNVPAGEAIFRGVWLSYAGCIGHALGTSMSCGSYMQTVEHCFGDETIAAAVPVSQADGQNLKIRNCTRLLTVYQIFGNTLSGTVHLPEMLSSLLLQSRWPAAWHIPQDLH